MPDRPLSVDQSPSETALSESDLNKKGLCDYNVNVADGCPHGCHFCYVKSMPMIWGDPGGKFADQGIDNPADEWGDYALVRTKIPGNLWADCRRREGDWRTTERGQGVVGISFGTDCYARPEMATVTRCAVEVLAAWDRPVRLLTRNPLLAATRPLPDDVPDDIARYRDLARDGLLTIGASIPAHTAQAVRAIEPHAPPIEQRFKGLQKFADAGVPVYVSMSPTYPTQDKADLANLLAWLDNLDPEVVFHEPINPRGRALEDCRRAAKQAGHDDLAAALSELQGAASAWRDYAVRHLRWVQDLGEQLDIPVHLWPDETLATDHPDSAVREWAQAWRERPSPEAIGTGPACTDPYPDLPPAPTERRTLGSFSGGDD